MILGKPQKCHKSHAMAALHNKIKEDQEQSGLMRIPKLTYVPRMQLAFFVGGYPL
jgi:hypothetical protein